jgi:DNA invertase Pin-like site-specific DNA recombinase
LVTAMPLRAARYLRVSRSDQNIDLQADETAGLIDRRGWTLVASFHDQGHSGAKTARPELQRLLAAARRREFDVLVVYRSDRLFRSLTHMVATLDELAALGIAFASTSEPFDSSTPQGKLLLHLVSAFSEFERSVLVERTKAGLDAARRRGRKLGRPTVRVDVLRAIALRSKGLSLQKVAMELGVGVGTLHRALADLRRVPESAPTPAPQVVEQ